MLHARCSYELLTSDFAIMDNYNFVTSSVGQLKTLVEEAAADDNDLNLAFKVLHQGYPSETLERFLKAREGNVMKAFKMIMDCLHWRANNDIDNILSKLIEPKEAYDIIRDSQLVGMTGFCKKGRPVFAIGVGQSGYDRASLDKYVQSHIQINEYRDRVLLPQATMKMGRYIGTCLKILDMSNLKLSALSRLKILTAISTVDDLYYPEKTDVYYIVNPPYIFSACWQAVRPLLQERTKRKIRLLQGSGKEELLKVMDSHVLPYFCHTDSKQGGSSNGLKNEATANCYRASHSFHVELWNYVKQQSYAMSKCIGPASQKSVHVELPDAECQTIECAVERALVNVEDNTADGENDGGVLNGISSLSLKDDLTL